MTNSTLAALKRAGIAIPESRQATPFHPDTLVVAFFVPVRPSPWRAPTTTRSGVSFKDKNLVRWQKDVATCCEMAMGGRAPYPHPVRLELEFNLKRRPGSVPDLSNLTKGTEDALQGLAIVNDRQVREIKATRTVGDADGVMIRVYSIGEE